MIEFSQEEIMRYPRHFSVGSIGLEGQKKIKASRVLLIGSGGIGSPAALYLAASGIGRLGLIDYDVVEPSNLQRQILFRTQDVGKRKVDVARDQLSELNPFTQIDTYPYPLSPQNASELFAEYDYILDGSDNYPTRYLVNEAARKAQKILISASVFQFGGQVLCLDPYKGPCYQCLYPAPPPEELIPNCTQAGVLGVIPGILALLAVNQIFIHILGLHSPSFFGRIHEFNGLNLSTRSFDIPSNPECKCCFKMNSANSPQPSDPYKKFQPFSCSEPQTHSTESLVEISAQQLDALISSQNPLQLIDVRESWEREVEKISPSVHIPLGDLAAQKKFSLNPDALTVAYCHAGIRSAKAAKLLQKSGFTHVSSLTGGIEAWKAYKAKTST